MKLTPEQQLEKKARENIRRLINRVSSEYSFKKWRNYRGYLNSIGIDQAVVDSTPDKELTRAELDELLQKYEEEAFKALQKPSLLSSDKRVSTEDTKLQGRDTTVTTVDSKSQERNVSSPEEKLEASNNYGLKESSKEVATLTWFQKKAAVELLKDMI